MLAWNKADNEKEWCLVLVSGSRHVCTKEPEGATPEATPWVSQKQGSSLLTIAMGLVGALSDPVSPK